MSVERKVMVAGKFDPPHDGHILHIVQAAALGDFLYVVVQPDEAVKKVKGRLNMPLWGRMALLKGVLELYAIRGQVVAGFDRDGKSIESLAMLQPDVFAKGGDRTPENMPQDEIEVCKSLDIEIVYGVGKQLNESSKMSL